MKIPHPFNADYFGSELAALEFERDSLKIWIEENKDTDYDEIVSAENELNVYRVKIRNLYDKLSNH